MRYCKVKKFKNVSMPNRAHFWDAGADLFLPDGFKIKPRETLKIPLGIGLELNDGFMAQVIERSSIGAKGLICAKSPIDASYRGEIHAIMTNNSDKEYVFNEGDRIAQLVITKIEIPTFREEKELSDTDRGTGAFGSTGK